MIGMNLNEFRGGKHVLTIPRARCVKLDVPAGLVVRCVSGEVWLTCSASAEDHFLEPGARYDCDRPESLYIDALGSASAIEISRATSAKVVALEEHRRAA